jgi:hypothetical protein
MAMGKIEVQGEKDKCKEKETKANRKRGAQ